MSSSYPLTILAILVECNGDSCGSPPPTGLLEYDDSMGYPEYLYDNGDFTYARCWRVSLGGGEYTWQLSIRYAVSGDCRGVWTFRLKQPADNPVGNYCRYTGGSSTDCSGGKAGVMTA